MRIRATVEVRLKGSIGDFHQIDLSTRCYPGSDVADCVLMEARRRGYEPRHILALIVILEKEKDESPPDGDDHTPMDGETGLGKL